MVSASGKSYIEKHLTERAAEGWELVSVFPNLDDGHGYWMIFRR